jgi:hypothetical protein
LVVGIKVLRKGKKTHTKEYETKTYVFHEVII